MIPGNFKKVESIIYGPWDILTWKNWSLNYFGKLQFRPSIFRTLQFWSLLFPKVTKPNYPFHFKPGHKHSPTPINPKAQTNTPSPLYPKPTQTKIIHPVLFNPRSNSQRPQKPPSPSQTTLPKPPVTPIITPYTT